ncbi:hypothetical protein CHUAL_007107 [Chamberlinius hualienensis]
MAHNAQWPSTSFNRMKTIELQRQENSSTGYGFSIRGGCEYGIGVYVSEVVEGSIAHTQGLKVGDKILNVNGLPIEEAVHEEVLNLILKSKSPLILKVRSVGMLPLRSQVSGLTWISTENIYFKDFQKVEINVDLSKAKKFGCSICKGPVNRPGIFVQSTVDGGVAHEVGLQPGDQLLMADGKYLIEMSFKEVVQYLKSCKQVKFLVRKRAAMDLFPYHLSTSSDEVSLNTNGSNETPTIEAASSCSRNKISNQNSTTAIGATEVVSTENVKLETNGDQPLVVESLLKMINVNGCDASSAVAIGETEIASEKTEKTRELQRYVINASKFETKEHEETVRKLIQSSFNDEIRSLAGQSQISDNTQNSDTNQESHSDYVSNDGNINKQNKHMWTKTPLAEIIGATEPELDQDKHSPKLQKETETNSDLMEERRTSHDRLIEEFRQVHKEMLAITTHDKKLLDVTQNNQRKTLKKDKKSVSFADSEIVSDYHKEDEADVKETTNGLLCNVKKQNIIVKPSPHMFVDPLLKNDEEKSSSQTNNQFHISSVRNLTAGSRKNITDSSPNPPKPPAFFFPPKAKVTIGSYESSHIPQRMSAYLPTNSTVINITKKVFSDEAKLSSEAKPLAINKLSIINNNTNEEQIQSSSLSFNAARAKFLINEKQLETADKIATPIKSKIIKENNSNIVSNVSQLNVNEKAFLGARNSCAKASFLEHRTHRFKRCSIWPKLIIKLKI